LRSKKVKGKQIKEQMSKVGMNKPRRQEPPIFLFFVDSIRRHRHRIHPRRLLPSKERNADRNSHNQKTE
jgi:hypothetical protein